MHIEAAAPVSIVTPVSQMKDGKGVVNHSHHPTG